MTELNAIAKALKKALLQVGAYQVAEQKKLSSLEVQVKGLNQLVSDVDVNSEKMLVEACTLALPEASFITEEGTVGQNKNAEYYWIIDPLDGTTNYLHGLAIYSISVALFHQGEPLLAWVYCPSMNQMFEAQKGHGAFLNERQIHVSQASELKDSLLATGFPYYKFDEMPEYLSLLEELMKSTHGLRRMGSAAIDLAYVAWGKFEGFFELNLSPWDVAAGVLLVTEAGGTMCDFKGGQDFVFGNSIVASNGKIDQEFKNKINQSFSV
jgi:myo-inositol-1(or 4)-monophosphatase